MPSGAFLYASRKVIGALLHLSLRYNHEGLELIDPVHQLVVEEGLAHFARHAVEGRYVVDVEIAQLDGGEQQLTEVQLEAERGPGVLRLCVGLGDVHPDGISIRNDALIDQGEQQLRKLGGRKTIRSLHLDPHVEIGHGSLHPSFVVING